MENLKYYALLIEAVCSKFLEISGKVGPVPKDSFTKSGIFFALPTS